MNYSTRLERLEAELLPELAPRVCVLIDEGDTDTVLAKWRAANDWPDDGRHPVHVLHVRFSREDRAAL